MTAPPGLPLRPELLGVEPYGAPELEVAVRLNVNENPYPPPHQFAADLQAAVADVAARLNRYPDREAGVLRDALASYLGLGLTKERVWPANGSNEVMLQVMQAFGGPGRSALSFTPTYSMYPEYARNTSTRWLTAPRGPEFEIERHLAVAAVQEARPDVVVLASPNNPTGSMVGLDVVKAVCEVAPGVVVVDEAYAEFRRSGVPSALSLLDDYPHLAVTRTMSKAFSLAGIRLGYLAGSTPFVDALRLVRLPYHLSALTQAAAAVALAHAQELLGSVDALRAERDATVGWLRAHHLRVADSDANFVLFGIFEDRRAVWQGLLDREVLIRETGPSGWLRVSIGTPEEMSAFKAALIDVLEGEG
ncbi:MAG: histidinol-phosphate transaminase [Nocardioidaceae bacterium]